MLHYAFLPKKTELCSKLCRNNVERPNKRDSIWEKAASVNLLSVSNLESTSWKERFGLSSGFLGFFLEQGLAVVDWTLWSLTTQTSESECVFFGSTMVGTLQVSSLGFIRTAPAFNVRVEAAVTWTPESVVV